MTNFEWLVKNGKTANFLYDVCGALSENAKGTYPLTITDQYNGLSIGYGENICKKCAEWLQAERKTKRKTRYVALNDVIDIFRMPRELKVKDTNRKIDMADILEMEAHHYFEMQTALFSLETKEIDE